MVDVRSEDDEVVEGVNVLARLRQGMWTALASDTYDGLRIVEDTNRDAMVRREIPGTEQTASGSFSYAPV